MRAIEVEALRKSFRIPSDPRHTVREHALSLFRPRRFTELRVLDGISFSVGKGESLGIMGANGCGKSTLMRILAGIYRPDGGRVTVRVPVTPILELGVGWNPELDALDNIELLGTVMGMSLGELRRATEEILAFAELEAFSGLPLKHYSSGMAVRLAYAVAFRAVRGALIADEVFAVGDAAFKRKCYARLEELRADGHSVLLVSHSPAEIADFCDRAILLHRGRIHAEGTGEEISAAYQGLLAGADRGDG